MRWKAYAIFPALMVLAASSVHAEGFAIAGQGAQSCGKYLELEKEGDKLNGRLATLWVQGFLSGTNTQRHWGSESMKIQPDPESIRAFLTKYCTDNPLENIYSASMALEMKL
ncbi:hypothetical protein [Pseudomonas sp. DG56-2]|uniref:hypothetical protein n=1 Tax=Pseudomonas sp. DG56-2 TaxID=2320270 RepID=UPI0010A5D9BD|nr:hypothetical protein [Pseudomonas sp. DG56-2]